MTSVLSLDTLDIAFGCDNLKEPRCRLENIATHINYLEHAKKHINDRKLLRPFVGKVDGEPLSDEMLDQITIEMLDEIIGRREQLRRDIGLRKQYTHLSSAT